MGIQQIGDLPRVKRQGLNKQQIRKKRFDYENYGGRQQEIKLIKKNDRCWTNKRFEKVCKQICRKKKSQRMNNKTMQ